MVAIILSSAPSTAASPEVLDVKSFCVRIQGERINSGSSWRCWGCTLGTKAAVHKNISWSFIQLPNISQIVNCIKGEQTALIHTDTLKCTSTLHMDTSTSSWPVSTRTEVQQPREMLALGSGGTGGKQLSMLSQLQVIADLCCSSAVSPSLVVIPYSKASPLTAYTHNPQKQWCHYITIESCEQRAAWSCKRTNGSMEEQFREEQDMKMIAFL